MGAAGGVTLMVLDKSLYNDDEDDIKDLACDVGLI